MFKIILCVSEYININRYTKNVLKNGTVNVSANYIEIK